MTEARNTLFLRTRNVLIFCLLAGLCFVGAHEASPKGAPAKPIDVHMELVGIAVHGIPAFIAACGFLILALLELTYMTLVCIEHYADDRAERAASNRKTAENALKAAKNAQSDTSVREYDELADQHLNEESEMKKLSSGATRFSFWLCIAVSILAVLSVASLAAMMQIGIVKMH